MVVDIFETNMISFGRRAPYEDIGICDMNVYFSLTISMVNGVQKTNIFANVQMQGSLFLSNHISGT